MVTELDPGLPDGSGHEILSEREASIMARCVMGNAFAHPGDLSSSDEDEKADGRTTCSDDDLNIDAQQGKEEASSSAEAEPPGPKLCYICYDDSEEGSDGEPGGNPLVSPCVCRGDTAWVHFNCLRKWQSTDAEDRIVHIVHGTNRLTSCPVCKTQYQVIIPIFFLGIGIHEFT